jgi:peptide/nickel transport system permease protein
VARREFVQAAVATGQTDLSILGREILPNVAPSLLAYALPAVSYLIVAEGALGFLGLSVPPPAPSWGGMILEGREVLGEAPHVSLIPALVLFATVLSFNLIGDAFRALSDSGDRQF